MPDVRSSRLSSRPFDRVSMRSRAAAEVFDVLVIGGGITGLGAAVDASARGLRTVLLERGDFASGTSSKSSKLVHGGLRYLQQGDVRLVYEALRERQRLLRNARHLVGVLPFMIPILTKDGLISRKVARALGSALWMYDLTGGMRIGRIHRRLRKSRALSHLPTMDPDRLASAYVYYDAQADDARLCISLARTAADRGAVVLNGAAAIDVERRSESDTSRLFRVKVSDAEGTFHVEARSIINAAGVWVDEVLSTLRQPGASESFGTIRPAKGIHITVPWNVIRNDIAAVIPVPKDRRSLFLVPWGPRPDGTFTHTYVGTTDTDYSGPRDEPQCTKDDIDYVLRALNSALNVTITPADVVGTWAGLRPLVVPADDGSAQGSKSRTADLSRRHRIALTGDGFVTVTGGKLTTYREMAQDAVDALADSLGISVGPLSQHRCRTKRLELHGSGARPTRMIRSANLTPALADHLWSRFGTEAESIVALIQSDPTLAEPLVDGLEYVRAEVVHAVRNEMALTVEDVLARRTRALLFDRSGAREAARTTAQLMAPLLGWNETRIEQEAQAFQDICDHESVSGSLTERELTT